MSLYRQVPFHTTDGEVVVPSGQLAVHAFILADDSSQVITIVHTEDNAQDLSLRAWISAKPGGSPMETNDPQTWNPLRKNVMLVGVMTEDAPYPNVDAAIRMSYLPPGSYVLNVLNLVHARNKFNISIRDGSSFNTDDDGSSQNCDC